MSTWAAEIGNIERGYGQKPDTELHKSKEIVFSDSRWRRQIAPPPPMINIIRVTSTKKILVFH